MTKFCVIGSTVTSNISRSWFDDMDKATTHGEGLARKSYGRDRKPVTLYVVQVMKVIEAGQPQVTTRDVNDNDAALADAEED